MASLEKTARPPQTLPVRAQERCPTLPALMERLAAPLPHTLIGRFGELNQHKSPGAAGRAGAELSLL